MADQMKASTEDFRFMQETLALAEMAKGWTGPDPMVAALVVKDGKVVSRGYHNEFTMPHAEAYALEKAGDKAHGATLYVNLEPCCHWGNNPPCTQNIIRAGIRRVVAAIRDPNPLVGGKGFRALRQAGIQVDVGVCGKEATELNEVFIKYITTGRPFVTVKGAMTLDGKIADDTGKSKWITGTVARRFGWQLRGWSDAVMVGANTILADDPLLTCHDLKVEKPALSSRHPDVMKTKWVAAPHPLKIVVDSRLRVSLRAKLFQHSKRVIVATTHAAPARKLAQLKKLGVDVIVLPGEKGRVNIKQLFRALADRHVASVLVEGGGNLNASVIQAGVVDKLCFFYAPKILGGVKSLTAVEGERSFRLAKALPLRNVTLQQLGNDFLVTGYFS